MGETYNDHKGLQVWRSGYELAKRIYPLSALKYEEQPFLFLPILRRDTVDAASAHSFNLRWLPMVPLQN